MTALVVEARAAASLPGSARAGLVVLPPARGRRRGVPPGAAADAMAQALQGPGAILLGRPPECDGEAAHLWQLARMLGLGLVRLPTDPVAAAWVAGLAAAWSASGEDGLLPRLQATAALAAIDRHAPRSPLRALRPPVLARWAGRAWRPCAWCPDGGLPARCGACGHAPAEAR